MFQHQGGIGRWGKGFFIAGTAFVKNILALIAAIGHDYHEPVWRLLGTSSLARHPEVLVGVV
jgi:hypothetical protein